jgi:hypothetical protein
VQIGISGPELTLLDEEELPFLDHSYNFRKFVRLVTSVNIFLRAHRAIRALLEINIDAPDQAIARELNSIIFLDIPRGRFAQLVQQARQSATVSLEDKLTQGLKNLVWKVDGMQCYLCGVALTASGDIANKRSVDHLWPQALGGASLIENLVPCCKDCNSKKQHDITWAWGPVQSTYESLARADVKPNGAIRMSLGIARLMFVALGATESTLGKTTLKGAAKKLGTAIPDLKLKTRYPYTYFELLHLAEASA